jgi:hypothetical protein
MTPEAKIWIILKKIDDTLAINPSDEPVSIDIKELEKKIPKEEQEQIFAKLAKDSQLFEIQKKPDYKNNFRYSLKITNVDLFRTALNDAHIKHFGSVEMLTAENFLAVVDVAEDIMDGLQMTETNETTIPLLRMLVRFNILMPGDGINARDRYCDLRWKALEYLTNKKYIKKFVLNQEFHRWESTITVTVDRIQFTKFYEHLMKAYKKRVVFDNKDEETKTSATIPAIPSNITGKNPYQALIDIIDILLIKIEITPKNRLTGNQIQIHISETSLPQNALGVEELTKILNTLKQSGSIADVNRSVGLFTISQPNKEILIKERERWVKKGGGEKQEQIQKIEIVKGKMEIEGLQDGLKTIAKTKKEEDKNKFPYKLPAGTVWENIIFQFLNDENVFIKVGQHKHYTNYKEMRLVGKGKKPNPSELWTFLKVLALENGEIPIDNLKRETKYKKRKELLSKFLQSYFGINLDPFYPYKPYPPYKHEKSYKIRMTLIPPPQSAKKQNDLNDLNEEDKDDLGIKEDYKQQTPEIYDKDQ